MILTCQKCNTSFKLDETLLKPTGSKVRCSLCQQMWVAFPPEPASEEHPVDGDEGRDAKSAVLGAAALGAGAVAAGLSEDEAGGAPSAETPPELKFFMDGELDETSSEDEDLVTDEINLDELDQLLSKEGDAVSGPRPAEDFKTEELDLADLEKMLDMEAGVSPQEDASPEEESRSLDAPGSIDAGEHLEDDLDVGSLEKEDSVIEELDLDLEDLENLLDEDTGLGDEIASVEEIDDGGQPITGEPATDEADDGEIALDMAPELENLLEEDGDGPFVEETEDLGDQELEGVRASSEPSAAMDMEEDQDFDLELAPGLDGIFDEGEDLETPIEETEELDFSELGADLEAVDQTAPSEEDDLELDLDLDQAPVGGHSDEAEDLAELELDLDSDTDGGSSAEEAAPELDLSALSQALGEDPGASGRDEAGAADPELELEMDLGDDEASGPEELDLELDDVDQVDASSTLQSLSDDLPEETRELGTDELEALLESAGDDQEAEPSSDSLELDIDLDGLEDGGEDEVDDATRELDLDDIEKILEMDTADDKAGRQAEKASEDLDLELDMDSIAPPPAGTEETGEETTDADDALDLSELEKMLDVEDTTDSPTSADEDLDDLDLDFDLQPTSDENDDLDLEFDMMDEEPEAASALFDTSESEDLGLDIEGSDAEKRGDDFESDLDFEIMDEDLGVEEVDLDIAAEEIGAETLSEPTTARRAGKAADQPSHRDLTQELMDEMAAADTQTMAAPPMETKPIRPAPPPVKRRKKSSKSLVLLLILVLLGGAAYLLPQYTDIKLPAIKMPDLSGIPFIGDFFAPATSEAIVPVGPSLTGDWVQNQRAGRLYTIQGQVRNEYQKPRSFIRVTGRVYANGRQFQRAATAYCGNVLTAEQLTTLPLGDIQKALSNRSGTDNVNVNVAPGQEVPFLVVFGDLPPDVELQEFAVEISGSLPVAGDK